MIQTVFAVFTFRPVDLINAGAAVLVVFLIGVAAPTPVQAQGLECPTIDRSAVAALDVVDSQIDRMTTENDVDLANEISGLISRLKTENPAASNDAITNILIAAYCPVVGRIANASSAEKWQLMRKFDRILMQQISANATPPGSSIIASIPLSPAVYQSLEKQAETSGQTTADLMAAILTSAAGH